MPLFRFSHPIEIRYGDLDPQGHVNNAKFLTYFEQARVAYLIHLGLFDPGQSFMEIGIILAEARVTFRQPVHFGQRVRVEVRTSRLGNKSLEMEYRLVDEFGVELATGSSVQVAFDYRQRRSIPIPEEWRQALSKFEEMEEIR